MKIEVLGNILDEEQTKAALYHETNAIIIAGAGAGKSLTMVGKIKYLVKELHVPIENILCITFTNNAAKSLEEKVKKELNLNNKVYTFHKLALEIMESYHLNYKIASEDLLAYLIHQIFTTTYPLKYFQRYFLTKHYLELKEFKQMEKLIERFILLYIGNYYDIKHFDTIIKNARKKDQSLLFIIKKIFEMYLVEKESSGLIDFDDMIYMATKLVQEKGIKKHYQYIIIDEYQDTSFIRENLVKEIMDKTKALLTVVGDDFQSIYRFSGCDINNFLDFPERFSPVKKLYLTSTYRNSQELIQVAGSFVMQNKRQIHKNLVSKKHLLKPIIILYYKDIKKDFSKALNYINSDNLMILGRNNMDIYNCVEDSNSLINDHLKWNNKNIYYKTIHKAKGLEEDNVLIINLTSDTYSLPSKIKEERILNYVLFHKDLFPYEEERRIFYVALTRTKNYCYLYVPKKNPSIFIEELVKHYKNYITFIHLS